MSSPEPSPAPALIETSARTVRFQSFRAEYEELVASAARFGIAADQVVLPAQGMLPGDGVRLHYLEWPGGPSDPLVLFLHGGGLHAHTFELVGLLLRDRARCVAVDLRGHGESDWAGPGQYGTGPIAADIASVVSALGARQVVVVGHSFGGMGALVYAATRPAELAGLVMVDIGLAIDPASGQRVHDYITTRPEFRTIEQAEAFVRTQAPGANPASSSVRHNLGWDDRDLLTWKHDPAQWGGNRSGDGQSPDLGAVVDEVECPTLILRGERSRILTDEAAADLAARMHNASWLRIPNAGHTIQSSNPPALASAVGSFIENLGLS